jgi:hypothetical protein
MPQQDDDPIAAMLRRQPLTPALRASVWDAFNDATDEDDLAQKLGALKIPQSVKADLWDMKAQQRPATPPPTAVAEPPVSAPVSTDWGGAQMRAAAGLIGDVAAGAGKELLAQGVRGGALLRQIPGVDALSNALPNLNGQVPVSAMTPEGGAERAGAMGFQVAEALAPARAVTNLGVQAASKVAPSIAGAVGNTAARIIPRAGVEAAAGGAMSALQGGSAAAGAALGGAVPVLGSALSKLAPEAAARLKAAAAEGVEKALGPTKEYFKALTTKITPEILKRGVRGSRESIKALSEEMVNVLGPQIDDAIQKFGDRRAGLQPVMDAIEVAKDAYRTTRQVTAAEIAANPQLAEKVRGFVSPGIFEADVVFEPRAVEQLGKLQKTLAELGDSARVDQLVAIRRTWDEVVAQAGGFAHRAAGAIGKPLADISEAEAKRVATSAIRSVLDDAAPELSKINKEFSFWKNLDDIVGQTLQRTAPQSKGLAQSVAEGAGAAAGALSGAGGGILGSIGAATVGKKLGGMLNSVFQSPRWKLASAQMKDSLAEAITSGNVSRAATILGRIGANRGAALTQPRGGQTIYSNRPGMAIPGASTGVPE